MFATALRTRGPGPAVLLVDQRVMDRLHPPTRTAEAEGFDPTDPPTGTALQQLCLVVASGACVCLSPALASELAAELPPPEPVPGTRVVALCVPRLDALARQLPGEPLEELVELVWLHELIHWAHGATSVNLASKHAEEAVTQIALASILREHSRGPELRQVMDAVAAMQPEHYRTYQALVPPPLPRPGSARAQDEPAAPISKAELLELIQTADEVFELDK